MYVQLFRTGKVTGLAGGYAVVLRSITVCLWLGFVLFVCLIGF